MLKKLGLTLTLCGSFATSTQVKSDSLLGPDFPAPKGLSQNALFEAAIKKFENSLSNDTYGPVSTNDTAFSVSVFTTEEGIIYEHHQTPTAIPISANGTQALPLDNDSIYRIGSISKLVTVYGLLEGAGFEHFHQPITNFVPELAAASSNESDVYDDISKGRWRDITLAQLASHTSGMISELSYFDLSTQPLPVADYGFKTLDESQIPQCGFGNVTQSLCTREQFFQMLLKQDPIFPTSQTPVYSNAGFMLIGFAMENILNKPIQTIIEDLFTKLGMSSSTYSTPKAPTKGVIPGGDKLVTWWDFDLGDEDPAGSYFCSTTDLAALGQSILSSKLLTPAQTRAWFKPLTHTGDLRSSVGAPWEIVRVPQANGHVIDLYIKGGSVGAYTSYLILSPDHNVGFTFLVATLVASPVYTLSNAMIAEVLSAIEEIARVEAGKKFGGTYSSRSSEWNGTAELTLGTDDRPGLIANLTYNGIPVLQTIRESVSAPLDPGQEFNLRAIPTGLETRSRRADGNGTYVSRTSSRITIEVLPPPEHAFFEGVSEMWLTLGRFYYGGMGLDELIFGYSEDGEVEYAEFRPMGFKMEKTA